MSDEVTKLVEKASTVVSMPVIFHQIDELINDPNSNLNDIADLISEDTGLSARLLRIANSALYSFPSEIDTILRAITVIGTRQLRDLVMATKVISVFSHIDQSVVNMKSFWQHSIGTALCAKVLATYRREANTEYFYLLGLLHDIGRLILFMEKPEQAKQTLQQAQQENILLFQAETAILGFDHSMVGAELLSAWKLPVSMSEAVRHHHHPSLALDYRDEAAIVHIADIIVNALSLGSSGEDDVPPLDDRVWKTLELSENIVDEIIKHLDAQYEEVMHIFLEDFSNE